MDSQPPPLTPLTTSTSTPTSAPSSTNSSPAASTTSHMSPAMPKSLKSRHGPKKPYKELTLVEKVQLIELAEQQPSLSQAAIAERYQIAKSNVCRILQRRQEYVRAFNSRSYGAHRKRKLKMKPPISEMPNTTAAAITLRQMFLAKGTDSLRAHMFKTHAVAQMFTCRSCSHAFPDKFSHDQHISTVHGGRADPDEQGDSTVHGGHPDEQGDSTVDDNNNSVGDDEHKPNVVAAQALLAQLTAARQQQRPNVPLCTPVTASMSSSVFPLMLQQALHRPHAQQALQQPRAQQALQQPHAQQAPTSNLHEILLKMRERAMFTSQHNPAQSTPTYNAALAAMLANNPGIPPLPAATIFPKLEPPQQTPLNLMASAAIVTSSPAVGHGGTATADHLLTTSDGDDEMHSQSTSTTSGEPDHQGHRHTVVRRTTPEAVATSTTHHDEVCIVKHEAMRPDHQGDDDDDSLSIVVDVEGDANNNDGDVGDMNARKELMKQQRQSTIISALNVPYKKVKLTPPPSTPLTTSSPDSSTTMATLMRSMLAAKDSSISPPTSSTTSTTNCGSCVSLRSAIDQQIQRSKFMEENMHSEMTRVKSLNASLATSNGQLQRRLLACQQRIVQYIQQAAVDPQAAHSFVEDILKSTLHA